MALITFAGLEWDFVVATLTMSVSCAPPISTKQVLLGHLEEDCILEYDFLAQGRRTLGNTDYSVSLSAATSGPVSEFKLFFKRIFSSL
jgi:hypothetical protein